MRPRRASPPLGRRGLPALALALLGSALTGLPSGAATVTGLVLDAHGKPRAGVRVELAAIPTRYEAGRRRLEGREVHPAVALAASDTDGRFSLEAPGPGLWRARASGEGLLPMEYFPIAVTGSVRLPEAVMAARVPLALEVRDGEGRPRPGVGVVARVEGEAGGPRHGWRPVPQTATTDSAGRATVDGAPGAPVVLSLFHPGSARTTTRRFSGGVVTIGADAGCRRRLRVAWADGTPVAGVLARALPRMWPVGRTDSRGVLELEADCERGARLLLQDHEGRQQPLELEPGRGEEVRSVVLERRRTLVHGRVLSATSGGSLDGALVWFQSDLGRYALADDKGRYRLDGPVADRFWIQAEATGHTARRRWLSRAELEGAAADVELERSATLKGTVTSRESGPVAGALVAAHLRRPGGGRPFFRPDAADSRAQSDEHGRFVLDGLVGDQAYEIVIGKPGFRRLVERVGVAAADRPVDSLRFSLLPQRGLAGRVTDPQGRPIGGAEVAVRPAGSSSATAAAEPLRARSDGKGAFELSATPAETVDVAIGRTGFAPRVLRSVAVADGRGALDLGTIVLSPGALLRGVVSDQLGEPLAGATVSCRDDSGPKPSACGSVISDEEGRFELADLAPGESFALALEARGFLPTQIRGVGAPAVEPLRISLEPALTLRGRVRDEERRPVAGAEVHVVWPRFLPGHGERFRVGVSVARAAVSDEAGSFSMEDVPAGRAEVDVSADGFVAPEPHQIVVSADDPSELSLTLRRGSVVTGSVTAAAGEPVAGARVAIGPATGVSDPLGRYRIDGVVMGEWDATVSHDAFDRETAVVEIRSASTTRDWSLVRGGQVAGWVRDEDARPVAGAEVSLRRQKAADRREYLGVTDATGHFLLPAVSGGTYDIEAVKTGFSRGGPERLVVRGAGERQETELLLRRGATLLGRISGLSSLELGKVGVVAEESRGRVVPGRVGPTGEYEIRHLPEGDWLILASLDGGRRTARSRLSIRPEDRRVERDLRFADRLELTGTISLFGEPLAGALVSLQGRDLTVQRSIMTGYDGRFRLQDLDAGEYELAISQSQNGIVHSELIELYGDRGVSIDLLPATVRGSLHDARSLEPVSGGSVVLFGISAGDGSELFSVGAGAQPDGSFVIPRVPPGRYRLRALQAGYSPAERAVTVRAGEDLTDLRIGLEPSRGLSVRVSTSAGRRLPFVELVLLDRAGRNLAALSSPVSAEGMARFDTVPSGSWTAALAGPGTAVASYPVTIPGAPLEAVLAEGREVEVRVAELVASDTPATVELSGLDGRAVPGLQAGAGIVTRWAMVGGQATVPGIPAGSWTVTVRAADGRVWTGFVATDGVRGRRLEL